MPRFLFGPAIAAVAVSLLASFGTTFGQSNPGVSEASSAKANPVLPNVRSSFGLQQDYARISSQIDEAREETTAIVTAITTVESAQQQIKLLPPDFGDKLLSKLEEVKTSLDNILKLQSTDNAAPTELSYTAPSIRAFQAAARDVERHVYGPTTAFYDAISSLLYARDSATEAQKAIARIMSSVPNPEEMFMDELMVRLRLPLDFDGKPTRVADLKPEIERLLTAIDAIDRAAIAVKINEEIEKSRRYATSLIAALQTAKKTRDANIKQWMSELEALDAKLIQGQKSQYQINEMLVYAIYMVIVALILLFFLLRTLPAGLAEMLIRTRTLFETVSLAFLMVTIIVLGIGDKIETETLGTLLGTIAGYIFGRQLARHDDTSNNGGTTQSPQAANPNSTANTPAPTDPAAPGGAGG